MHKYLQPFKRRTFHENNDQLVAQEPSIGRSEHTTLVAGRRVHETGASPTQRRSYGNTESRLHYRTGLNYLRHLGNEHWPIIVNRGRRLWRHRWLGEILIFTHGYRSCNKCRINNRIRRAHKADYGEGRGNGCRATVLTHCPRGWAWQWEVCGWRGRTRERHLAGSGCSCCCRTPGSVALRGLVDWVAGAKDKVKVVILISLRNEKGTRINIVEKN